MSQVAHAQPPSEVRIIEDQDGFVCATYDPVESARRAPGGLEWLVFCLALASLLGMPVALWWYFHQPLCAWRRLRCTLHGIELDHVYTHMLNTVPTVEHVRDDNVQVRTLQPKDTKTFLPYSEIADMGHTDYSLWFLFDNGERQELMLEQTPRAELERIHGTFRPVWERARQALLTDKEEAEQQRRQLAQVTRQA